MNTAAEHLYAAWRQRGQVASRLQETGDGPPPETVVQAIWQHQRLQRDRLRTRDGRPVRVLHPGFATTGGGPDFRGAIVQFGDDPPVTGEIEVDLVPGGWQGHGHDANPRFAGVILQVVWQAGRATATSLPVLAIQDCLDAPLAELAEAMEQDPILPAEWRGQCSAPLRELSAPQLADLLHAAAMVRFRGKAGVICARARQTGWEQALWEQLFRALGYRHNVWPMQHLAETRARWQAGADSVLALQTRLLGVSGLLPAELASRAEDSYLRRAWDGWWRERDRLASHALPRHAWRFNGVRPANHPQRRLALAAHWLAAGNLPARLEAWCAQRWPTDQLASSLAEIFQPSADAFWSHHWTLTAARLTRPQPLLGADRVNDLAVNVVLPWLWVRAREGGNAALQSELEARFAAWPAAADNAVLRQARQRLLGTRSARNCSGAARQQGLLQIVRDFCDHSNALCAGCRFPGLVRDWAKKG